MKKIKFDTFRQMVLVIILIVMCIVWAIMSPNFLTMNNLMNVVRQASYTAIASVGMTMVIIIGEIDLSAGSLIAASGMIAAAVYKSTGNIVLAFAAAILSGVLWLDYSMACSAQKENCRALSQHWPV